MAQKRREFVAGLIASGTLSGLSGCSVIFGPRPDFRIRNFHNDPHDVSVKVTYSGKVLLEDNFSLGPEEQSTRMGLFDEVGEYMIEATVDNGKSGSEVVTVRDPGADIFAVTVQNDGGLSIGGIGP